MGKAKGFGPVPSQRGAPDEEGRVGPGAADRGGQDRATSGRDPEEAVGGEETPPSRGVPREPFVQGRPDPDELGRAPGECDDRDPQRTMDRVEVEYVEPSENRSVEEHRSQTFERPRSAHECDHLSGSVPAVHADPAGPDRFYIARRRDDDRGDRGGEVGAYERAVVDPHDARMRLPE